MGPEEGRPVPVQTWEKAEGEFTEKNEVGEEDETGSQ
jgi:hypothetical protein